MKALAALAFISLLTSCAGDGESRKNISPAVPVVMSESPTVSCHDALCGAIVLLSDDGETLTIGLEDLVLKTIQIHEGLVCLPSDWMVGETIAVLIVGPVPMRGETIKAHIPAEWEPGYRQPEWHKRKKK